MTLLVSNKERSAADRTSAVPDVVTARLAGLLHQYRGVSGQDVLWPAGTRRVEYQATSNVASALVEGRHPGRPAPLPTRLSASTAEARFSAMSVAVGVAFLFLCKPSADDQGQKWKLRA